MQALIGEKKLQSQRFLENGSRIPVTLINVEGNKVISLRTMEKNNYQAAQLGFGIKAKKSKNKDGAKTEAPKFLREVRTLDEELPNPGDVLNPAEVFKPGDIVKVTGVSKGKGYAGVVKRHNFRGGPKTHGQSDRHRAPGAIGQGTTPGRVYKGKRMSGRMGNENVSISNLLVVDVDDKSIWIKGLVPGVINGLVQITKTGEHKKFIPLYKEEVPAEEVVEAEAKPEEVEEVKAEETQEVKAEEPAVSEQKSEVIAKEDQDEQEKVAAEQEQTAGEEVKEDGGK
jgi:large subunit ribosomal protein L3